MAAAVSLRLPEDVSKRLESLVELTGRSKTYYMIEAIREHIGNLEDVYVAERELEAIRAGTSTSTSLSEVMQRYGMES